MSEFPNTYHTETTTTTTTTTGGGPIALDSRVIKSKYGIVKIAEIVLSLLGFICILSTNASTLSRGAFYNTTALGGFWYSVILLALYSFLVPARLPSVPWKKIEFVFVCIFTLFFLIASSLAANYGAYYEGFAAAAFFGFCAMLVYGFDAWECFSDFGGVFVVRSTTTTSPNAQTPTTY